MSTSEVTVACHDRRHTELLIRMHFPIVVEARGADDGPFSDPPFEEIEAWCAATFETGDAFIQNDDRFLYVDRRWCLFGGVFRFKTSTDATAFKLRWV